LEAWEKSIILPPHPNLLPPGEKGLFAPSPLRGEGWGEGDLIASSNLRKKYSCNMRAKHINLNSLYAILGL